MPFSEQDFNDFQSFTYSPWAWKLVCLSPSCYCCPPLCVFTWSIQFLCHYLLKCIDLRVSMWETKIKENDMAGTERMHGVRAMSEILYQTDKLNPGDECSVAGRIILHNKRFIFRLIIDSWSQARQRSRHIWALGAVIQRRAAGGGGITTVIWQLPYLIQTLLLTLVITKPLCPEQPFHSAV